MTETLTAELQKIVGEKNVLVGKDVSARASHFWHPEPLCAKAVVRPRTTAEISAVLQLCHACDQTVVTHGGVTGLAGGEQSGSDDIVLTLERMTAIESVDPANRTIVVEAGAKLHSVQMAATDSGLQFGLDLGARGSCTIGGNISTNAGGLSVLRYGMMREQVLGLEAVLADGTILSSMNQMMKNNTGYDLKQLFIGSEGTLGVVTRAVLRLRPLTPAVNTAMLAFESFDQVQAMLSHISQALNAQLNAFEVMWSAYYKLNTNKDIAGSVKAPLRSHYPLYAIIESRGTEQARDATLFTDTMEQAFEKGLVVDAVIAQSEQDRVDLWAARENVDLTMQVHAPLFVYDISLPITSMEAYLTNVEKALNSTWNKVAFYAYGHLADGNLHVLVAPELSTGEKNDIAHEIVDELILTPLQALGGSISAEHGIGLQKKRYLKLSRTEAEIELMRKLKATLDPKHILNRNKILPT